MAQDLTLGLGLERLRGRDERQRRPSAEQGGGSPKLAEALSLMEANLAEPLPTEEVARLVGVSRRQLERLFKQHLDALPSRYYLELRLNRAPPAFAAEQPVDFADRSVLRFLFRPAFFQRLQSAF